MHELEAILKVLIVGLILGAGLPALFAVGMRAFAAGSPDENGTATNPLLRGIGIAVFVVIAAVIVLAILWIARTNINHHFGVNLFPFAPVK